MVLGGSDDGGYYLIGVKRLHHRLFEQTDSAQSGVRADPEASRRIGLRAELLPTWYDVDDAATLERLQREFAAPSGAGFGSTGYDAKHTRGYLHTLQAAQASFTTSSTC